MVQFPIRTKIQRIRGFLNITKCIRIKNTSGVDWTGSNPVPVITLLVPTPFEGPSSQNPVQDFHNLQLFSSSSILPPLSDRIYRSVSLVLHTFGSRRLPVCGPPRFRSPASLPPLSTRRLLLSRPRSLRFTVLHLKQDCRHPLAFPRYLRPVTVLL